MSYYPSQAGTAYGGQQVMYQNPGYVQTASYGVPASGVAYVPPSRSHSYSMGSHYYDDYHDYRPRHRHRRPHRRYSSYERTYSYPNYSYSGVPMSQPAMMMQQQPSYTYAQPGYYGQPQWTLGQRIRLFFGLAPTPAFKYRSDKNTWGFMGYSRRQRYIDPRTGQEVDRDGRPVLRV